MYLAACWVLLGQSTITGHLREQRKGSMEPVWHCTVVARSADKGPLVGEYPDAKGHFILDLPPDDQVTVGTVCPGYRVTAANGRHVEALRYDCSEPGPCAEVEFTLERLGVIDGNVIDENGMPVERIPLALHGTGNSRGLRDFTAMSDDRGYFRFYHLPPDAYELEPVPRSRMVLPGVVWEGVRQRIDLKAGDIVSGIAVPLQVGRSVAKPHEPTQLTGRIEGLPPNTTTVQLRVEGASTRTIVRGPFPVDSEGRFRLLGFLRQGYQLWITLPEADGHSNSNRSYSMGVVQWDQDANEVLFSLSETARLRGNIVVERSSRNALTTGTGGDAVSFELTTQGGFRRSVDTQHPNHRFAVGNLPPGEYQIEFQEPGANVSRLTQPGAWEPLSEIVLAKGEATELNLRVRFDPGRLITVVRPEPGSEEAVQRKPASHYLVAIRSGAGVKLLSTDQNGRLVISRLRPGDYEICAWRDITQAKTENPLTWTEAGDAVRRFRYEGRADVEITLTAAP